MIVNVINREFFIYIIFMRIKSSTNNDQIRIEAIGQRQEYIGEFVHVHITCSMDRKINDISCFISIEYKITCIIAVKIHTHNIWIILKYICLISMMVTPIKYQYFFNKTFVFGH